MKYVFRILLLALVAIGGYYAYENFIADKAIHILEDVQHELSMTEEFVFSRDNMKFSEIQNNKKFLAHVNYLYTWEANVPFGFSSKDLKLDYDKDNKVLNVEIKTLRLFPFQIHNKKAKKTSEFAWLNQGDPVAKFWQNIEGHTKDLINKEFSKKPNEVASVKQISKNSLTISVQNILKKLALKDVEVRIRIDKLALYNGKRV
ncbi:hypothetical protein ACFQ1M_03760 [Sungkyunkwania multivorans]|uniref:DUF4230 domain-containing protein n=1 Tax=Sungkyunkwania multivorans TaxID=1173618 RepID=A0ABW3CU59_9FLAO